MVSLTKLKHSVNMPGKKYVTGQVTLLIAANGMALNNLWIGHIKIIYYQNVEYLVIGVLKSLKKFNEIG